MSRVPATIPGRGGVGLKPAHVRDALGGCHEVAFFEVHAENYMGDGGAPLANLERVREAYPLSLHGVGLSIGADRPLDRDHLDRLKRLAARFEVGLFSEHLAWSSHDTVYANDLLPLPYNDESLALVCRHVDEVQQAVGRRMLLENPSSYLVFETSAMSEIDFLAEVARHTGCGLLLDVNNVEVSAVNLGFAPDDYLDAFPMDLVGEIHLAGHAEDRDDRGAPLLIDSHDRPVDEAVWSLYARAVARAGRAVPTLVEWDNDVPPFATLAAEASRAERVMAMSLDDLRFPGSGLEGALVGAG